MNPILDNNHYPVFEANQVLTSEHLNDIFNYLDEQQRLTRANLIGIGIVCGLEVKLDTTNGIKILLSKGCGVTSQGYLIVEPADKVSLGWYRDYLVPKDLGYAAFTNTDANPPTQYKLWEILAKDELEQNNTSQLDIEFLTDKVVLLFLELKKQGLRNCSINNCDDKGAEVTSTIKRLLIDKHDLDMIIKASKDIDASSGDYETTPLQLNLDDLRLPRFDVPSSDLVFSHDILAAFLTVFKNGGLVSKTAKALSDAYQAFKPLLQDAYPIDPFSGFNTNFGFLDEAPTTMVQVRFLQYYYDFFDDLIRAYDEFRWKGVELICTCCPSGELFPRHLMLGYADAKLVSGDYRQEFLASSAITGCVEHTRELNLMFQRLVEMVNQFTDSPKLPQTVMPPIFIGNSDIFIDPQIRITPSVLGGKKLADKAIPYYYQQSGEPPLYQLWSIEKRRQKRSSNNLSYRYDEYVPPAPAFVSDPLRFDLEPYDFLRIEGHLGKDYQRVLGTLLSFKDKYRLPIQVVALRSGVPDESTSVDLSKESCRFQDLEALYDALKEEFRSFLAEELTFFYDLPVRESDDSDVAVRSIVPILIKYRPDFLVRSDRLGALFESQYKLQAFSNELLDLVSDSLNTAFFRIIFHIVKLGEAFTENLGELDFDNLSNWHRKLEESVRELKIKRRQRDVQLENPFYILRAEDINDRLEAILFNWSLDAFQSIQIEYQRRIGEAKRKQFLSSFLKNNPGIQHKAGVPLGGTFIVVYHEDPGLVAKPQPTFTSDTMAFPANPITATPLTDSQVSKGTMLDILNRIKANPQFAANPDISLLLQTVASGIADPIIVIPLAEDDKAYRILQKTVKELVDGTVIADFFLPYQYSCDCNTVQFILPKIVPTFSVRISCTDVDGNAQVAITPKGGLPPYSVKIDANNYVQLVESFPLMHGTHVLIIRDADNIESEPQTLIVPTPLTLGEERYITDFDKKTYQVSLSVTGGTAPYNAISGTLDNADVFTSDIVESGAEIIVEITDSVGCKVTRNFTHEVLRPTFTVKLTCTNFDGNAQVTVTPQDGVSPYSIKIVASQPIVRLAASLSHVAVDTLGPVVVPVPSGAGVDSQGYAQLVEPLVLAQGSYSLTIKDSIGNESLSQVLTVPMALTLGEPAFQCNDKYTAYSATFPIIGGTMPYKVNGVRVDGSSYTSEQIPSGKPISIEVIDANKCTAKAEATYTCVVPCGLPCNGIALQRGYRFWLPEPGAKLSYDILTIIVNQFALELAPGKPLDLTADVQKILIEFLPAASLNKDFNGTVVKCMNAINDLIAKKIGNPDFLKLVYQSDPNFPGILGMLLIEYFECLSFKFDMVSTFPHPNSSGKLRTIYEPVGTSFMGLISAPEGMQIPVINGIRIDKCNPETKPTILCQEPIDLVLNIASVTDPKNNVIITVTPGGKEIPVSYLCELPDSFPFMNMGPIATFKFNLSDFPVKQVRITAFTKNGCWISKNYNINIG